MGAGLLNPGSNQMGDPGMLRGITETQSGKYFVQCLAKDQAEFINNIIIKPSRIQTWKPQSIYFFLDLLDLLLFLITQKLILFNF